MKASNRRIWITGASSGIGRATAREFAERGAKLVLTARNESKLKKLAEQCSTEAIVATGDVTKKEDIEHVAEIIEERWGALDVAFLNAGIRTKEGRSFRARQFERDYEVNVVGLATCIEHARPLLEEGEHPQLVGMSSMAGYRPMPGNASYGSSKAAVRYIMRCLQQEWDDIDVSVVCPGYVESKLTDREEGWQPFKVDTSEAGRAIVKGIEQRHREIHFPKLFTYMIKFATFFPYWLQYYVISLIKETKSSE